MNRKIAITAILLLLAIVISVIFRGWDRRLTPAVAPDDSIAPDITKLTRDDNRSESPSNQREIPSKYHFGGNTVVPIAEDDQSLLANYSPEEQRIIRAFYSGFGSTGLKGAHVFDNVFSFKNQKQLAWLAANGYPLPDDILVAARMSTDELLSMAKQGNFKAKAMLLVREYQSLAVTADQQVSTQAERYKELATFQEDVLSDGSPFAGYVWAAEHIKKPIPDGRAGVLAGYAFAETLGDDRAAMFANEYARMAPGMNPVEAIASYKTMLNIASKNPQMANTVSLMRRQRFQIF